VRIGLDDVAPSPDNPRRRFDEAALAELAESIKAHGVLEPVLVRPAGSGSPASREAAKPEPPYVLVAGERRWRAARLAGLTHVPAIVKTGLSDDDALKLALIENLQRVDLDPLEEAEGYQKLAGLGMTQREIAGAVNRSPSRVSHVVGLLTLPEAVRRRISAGELATGHGEALAQYKAFPELQERLGRLAVERGASVARLARGARRGGLLGEFGVQQELERAGALKLLGYWEPFDARATCSACPFAAFRKTDTGNDLCLKPDHYRQLVREAQRAQEARRKEAVAAAEAAGTTIPNLKDLPSDVGRLYSPGDVPEGCDEGCPCRASALNDRGEPVAICTDPKRFRSLQAAVTRREKGERLRAVQAVRDVLLAKVEGVEAVSGWELALVMVEGLRRADAKVLAEAAVQFCPEHAQAIANARLTEWDGWRRAGVLAGVEPVALLRLVLWTLLSHELSFRASFYHDGADLVDWYLETAPPRPLKAPAS